jgi:hypothetical protein
MEARGTLNAGDMSALVEAVEPALKRGHTTIGNGASQIFIISGGNNRIKFDNTSKGYVFAESKDSHPTTALFSVASFNANTGNGRVYSYSERRTIPFVLGQNADALTINTLMSSIRNYTHRKRLGNDLQSAIALKYQAIHAPDGRIKKITLLKARSSTEEL